jgi:hypothetical protein
MSILGFLRIIEAGWETRYSGPRTRALSLESLENRSVLTLLPGLPMPPPPEAPAPPTFIVPPSTFPPTTTAPTEPAPPDSGANFEPPATSPPLEYEPPVGDPPSSEPLPDPELPPEGETPTEPIGWELEFPQAPVIQVHASANGEWVTISGFVTDDEDVAGLTVVCFTDSGLSFSMTVEADGSFQSGMLLLPHGTMIGVWTIDHDGMRSNTAVCSA